MSTTIEETALATRTEQSLELSPTASAAEKQYEIQSAIAIAKRFPRNEDAAFARLMKAAERSSFAEDAAYSYPRGGQAVEGPSVNLAREAARVWGNIQHGLTIIRDDEDTRQIRGWAWDMESNTRVSAEDQFQKLIQRKGKNGGPTQWVRPDERDLRELTNKRGAILVRNCILHLLPKDLIEDALERCEATLKKGAQADPDGARKKLILAFGSLNVTPEMLEQRLGHRLAECSPAEIAELRTIYKSIADGNSTWSEYVGTSGEPVQPRRASEAAQQTQAPAASGTTSSPSPAVEPHPPAGGLVPSAPNGGDSGTSIETHQARGCVVKTRFVKPQHGEPYYEVTLQGAGDALVLMTRDERLYKDAASFEDTEQVVVVDWKADGIWKVLCYVANAD